MPANAPYTVAAEEDILEIKLVTEDLEPRRNVYFTDQSPSFEIQVENVGDRHVEDRTNLRFSFEESSSETKHGDVSKVDIDLDPGESEIFLHEIDMLPYQGTAAIAVTRCRTKNQNDDVELDCSRRVQWWR